MRRAFLWFATPSMARTVLIAVAVLALLLVMVVWAWPEQVCNPNPPTNAFCGPTAT